MRLVLAFIVAGIVMVVGGGMLASVIAIVGTPLLAAIVAIFSQ